MSRRSREVRKPRALRVARSISWCEFCSIIACGVQVDDLQSRLIISSSFQALDMESHRLETRSACGRIELLHDHGIAGKVAIATAIAIGKAIVIVIVIVIAIAMAELTGKISAFPQWHSSPVQGTRPQHSIWLPKKKTHIKLSSCRGCH
jgi:hypothetical protein